MDELLKFLHKPEAPVSLRGGQTSGVTLVDPLPKKESVLRSTNFASNTTDYAKTYKKQERALMEQACLNSPENENDIAQSRNTLMSLPDTVTEAELQSSNLVYSKYSCKREIVPQLTINDMKDEILRNISANRLTIIEGPTGCGKTTQVPQWILEECWQFRQHCNIIVTQPRRIAAINIAKRVAQERGWECGTVVGYQVGLDNMCTDETKLSYVTTGVLLQKLVLAKTLSGYTHIILDEVHERGQEMDFLLVVIRKLLLQSQAKVILMSATFNAHQFAKYFAKPNIRGEWEQMPVLKVEKKSPHEIKIFYLDQIRKFGFVSPANMNEPRAPAELFQMVLKLLNAFEAIDVAESDVDDEGCRPSVLIFLPGINEIEELFDLLHDDESKVNIVGTTEVLDYEWTVMPLHSTITAGEQAQVFTRPPPGQRKIILSTNIAESSITVPDIKYVIDFCLMKVLVVDEITNFPYLKLKWATHVNLTQRLGRAGRVRSGRVYRLIHQCDLDNLENECKPEMERCPLERLVLLAKTLDMGTPKEILALAMNPPNLSNLHRTILTLKEVGGLTITKSPEDVYDPEDGDLTYMGKIMSKLPVDIRIAKLIVLGNIFGVLNEAVIMGAAMSVKNIFSHPFQEKLNAYNSKLTWADGSMSDCIALFNAYKVWDYVRRNNQSIGRGFYLQTRALRELDELVRELRHRLSREGIDTTTEQARGVWNPAQKQLAIKLVIAGAFYPYYFSVRGREQSDARDAARELGMHDPVDTVYLKDFATNQPPELYVQPIKSIIKDLIKEDCDVYFDNNSSKVYISFSRTADNVANNSSKKNQGRKPDIPGKVVLPVYKAVKVRQLKTPIIIPMLAPVAAEALAEEMRLRHSMRGLYSFAPDLPDISQTFIEVAVTHQLDCGNFWVQYNDESTLYQYDLIFRELQGQLRPLRDPIVGEVCVAAYKDENYRVRILSLEENNKSAFVHYIDWGGCGTVLTSGLKNLPSGLSSNFPAVAVRARLAGIAPSTLLDPRGTWTDRAQEYFNHKIKNKKLIAKIFSVYHGKIAIELLINGKINLNEDLVNEGLAQYAEESYDSKVNNELRQNCGDMMPAQQRGFDRQQREMALVPTVQLAPVNLKDAVIKCVLKGPYSPLEVSVSNLMYGGRQKDIHIEGSSVNSVLLDPNPDEPYERLLIAGNITQTETGKSLTLRNTTVMPAIPGLAAIVPLIFCPTMEMRTNFERTRFVQFLCGLGHIDGESLYPEHDMIVDIDINMTTTEFETINNIRYLIDAMLNVPLAQENPALTEESAAKVPEKLRNLINDLLRKKRRHYAPSGSAAGWQWGVTQANHHPSGPDLIKHPIYPLHSLPDIIPLTRAQKQKLLAKNDELYSLMDRNMPTINIPDVVCPICDPKPMSVHLLRIHLNSRSHQENVKDLLD